MSLPPPLTWPLLTCPADPYAGDTALPFLEPGHDPLHTLEREVTLGLRSPLHPEVGPVVLAHPRIPSWAHAIWSGAPLEMAVADPIPRPPPAPRVPADDWFSDLAEDYVPELGLLAPERVFGPWADQGLTRSERLAAAAVMSMVHLIPPEERPVDRWFADRKGTPCPDRASAHAVDLAPPVLWQVRQGQWTPLLPLDWKQIPQEPVLLHPRRTGDPVEPAADGPWIARVYEGPSGWLAGCAVPLPCPIDPRVLLARLVIRWLEDARHPLPPGEPHLYWTRFLRTRGDLVYRSALEMAWLEMHHAS